MSTDAETKPGSTLGDLTPEQVREAAAALCEAQARAFDWHAGRATALESDPDTARVLDELAGRIRRMPLQNPG